MNLLPVLKGPAFVLRQCLDAQQGVLHHYQTEAELFFPAAGFFFLPARMFMAFCSKEATMVVERGLVQPMMFLSHDLSKKEKKNARRACDSLVGRLKGDKRQGKK